MGKLTRKALFKLVLFVCGGMRTGVGALLRSTSSRAAMRQITMHSPVVGPSAGS